MLLGNERILREAHTEDHTVSVMEIGLEGKVYCRVHRNFEDSNSLHVPFEDLCKRYNIPLDLLSFKLSWGKDEASMNQTTFYEYDEKCMRECIKRQIGYKLTKGCKFINVEVL